GNYVPGGLDWKKMTLREKAQWFNDNSITPSMLLDKFPLSDIILLSKNGYKITQQDAENVLRASGDPVKYKQLMEGAGLPTPKILPTLNLQRGSGFTIDDVKRYQNEYGVDVAKNAPTFSVSAEEISAAKGYALETVSSVLAQGAAINNNSAVVNSGNVNNNTTIINNNSVDESQRYGRTAYEMIP
ncbi:hypothetical protein EB118_23440, partial [bacterium]|nr:hypothetical protein [bacterium]